MDWEVLPWDCHSCAGVRYLCMTSAFFITAHHFWVLFCLWSTSKSEFSPKNATQTIYCLSCACTHLFFLLSAVIPHSSLVESTFCFQICPKTYHYHWDHDKLQCTTWLSQILLSTNVKSKLSLPFPRSLMKILNRQDSEEMLVESCPLLILPLLNSSIPTVNCALRRKKKIHLVPVYMQPSSN